MFQRFLRNFLYLLYQPVGAYLTSFTEADPTVSAYAKSLTSFNVIKASTDALYATQSALNGKQNTITLTTTGTGAATLNGSTLNIPTITQGVRVFVSTATAAQSRSQLNATYPAANVGDMVVVPINLGGAVYIKTTTGTSGEWRMMSAPIVL